MISVKTRQWLIKAASDLQIISHELSRVSDDKVTDAICFHGQQAVEKCLKGYLCERGVDFPKTHNLPALLKLCIDTDNDFSSVSVGELTIYAVESRYPDDFYTPGLAEAEESARIARIACSFVGEKLDIADIEHIG